MVPKLPLRKFFPLLTILLFLVSCVDDGYDLSDLDTDKITLGEKIVGPLGKVTITADDILDVDQIDEIEIDPATGDYVARFTDYINVTPDDEPRIIDQSFLFNGVSASFSGYSPGSSFTAPLAEISRPIELETSSEIVELHSAEFNTDWDRSLMIVSMNLEGFTVRGGTATVNLTMPEGYTLDTGFPVSGVSVDRNTLVWNVALDGSASYEFFIPISQIVFSDEDRAYVSGSITLNSGSTLQGASGTVRFGIEFEKLDYRVIYGVFDVNFASQPTTADLGNLSSAFEGDNTVLSFRDPHILMETYSNIGIPLRATMDITPDTDAAKIVRVDNIDIPAAPSFGLSADARYWIGEHDPASSYFTFLRAEGLGSVIADSQDAIYISGRGKSIAGGAQMFYPEAAHARLDYTVEIPLAPDAGFYAVTEQYTNDVFDDDIVEYLFSSGTAELYGTATNGIPLFFRLEMIITDYDGNPIGIDFPKQDIQAPGASSEPAVSNLSFVFDEAAIAKMERAKSIIFRFEATGTDDSPALNEDHELMLSLRIRKSGGILVSSDDDEQE